MAPLRLVLLALFLVTAACSKEAARGGPAPSAKSTEAASGHHQALLEIRVDLSMDIASADHAKIARAAIERTTAVGGFVESSATDAEGSSLVLRVPTAEVESVRSILAGYGPLGRETRTAKDVTDSVMDLDARVKSSKVEEQRLLELLEKKTGNLADVLAVEKALADVRERIERFETEQRAAHGRVELAVVAVRLNVRGAFDGAPLGQQLAIAAREGVSAARTAGVVLMTTTLRAGPTLLMLAFAAWGIVRVVRRLRAA